MPFADDAGLRPGDADHTPPAFRLLRWLGVRSFPVDPDVEELRAAEDTYRASRATLGSQQSRPLGPSEDWDGHDDSRRAR